MLIPLSDAAEIIGCQSNTLRARLFNQPWLIPILGAKKFANVWAFEKTKVILYAKTKRVNRR